MFIILEKIKGLLINQRLLYKLYLIILISLFNVANASNLSDWTNEDLCRWTDATEIPKPISSEIINRNLSCYLNCDTNQFSARVSYCSKENKSKLTIKIINNERNERNEQIKFSSNPAFNGLDMSGFTPPRYTSMDRRIFYINGIVQYGGTTYIRALKTYLESTGQGDAYSETPPKLDQSAPVKFDFQITL